MTQVPGDSSPHIHRRQNLKCLVFVSFRLSLPILSHLSWGDGFLYTTVWRLQKHFRVSLWSYLPLFLGFCFLHFLLHLMLLHRLLIFLFFFFFPSSTHESIPVTNFLFFILLIYFSPSHFSFHSFFSYSSIYLPASVSQWVTAFVGCDMVKETFALNYFTVNTFRHHQHLLRDVQLLEHR